MAAAAAGVRRLAAAGVSGGAVRGGGSAAMERSSLRHNLVMASAACRMTTSSTGNAKAEHQKFLKDFEESFKKIYSQLDDVQKKDLLGGMFMLMENAMCETPKSGSFYDVWSRIAQAVRASNVPMSAQYTSSVGYTTTDLVRRLQILEDQVAFKRATGIAIFTSLLVFVVGIPYQLSQWERDNTRRDYLIGLHEVRLNNALPSPSLEECKDDGKCNRAVANAKGGGDAPGGEGGPAKGEAKGEHGAPGETSAATSAAACLAAVA